MNRNSLFHGFVLIVMAMLLWQCAEGGMPDDYDEADPAVDAPGGPDGDDSSGVDGDVASDSDSFGGDNPVRDTNTAVDDDGNPTVDTESSVCSDIAPDDQYTCSQQAQWGKCQESWMQGFCDISCDRCREDTEDPASDTDTGGVVVECGQVNCNPQADSKARSLLCYLRTHSYISGQTDIPDAQRVHEMTGRYPAIVAFDFHRISEGQTGYAQNAINWYRERDKGIVKFAWHWQCPRGGNYNESNCNIEGDFDNPNSKMYQDIDAVAGELKQLSDAGIPVIFRPLHESNDGYMWWARRGEETYIRLYRLIWERVRLAGATSVVWDFNGMAGTDGWRVGMDRFYPGDAYIDLVTSDYYQSWNDYNYLRGIGNGKTVAVSETFRPLQPDSEPAWAYFIVWASRDWRGSNQPVEDLWRSAMQDSRTICMNNLPDMSRW